MRRAEACLTSLIFISSLILHYELGEAQTVPDGFSVIDVNTNLDADAIGFALLPDGRVLVVHQFSGEVKLIVNGNLISTPLLTVANLATSSEKGLLGIAIDPGQSHSTSPNSAPPFESLIPGFLLLGPLN